MVDLTDVNHIKSKGVLLHSKDEVEAGIQKVADEMKKEIGDKTPLFLVVMNGAVIFAGQLATHLDFPVQYDYIHATRYRGKMQGSELHWIAKPRAEIKGRTVVVVEDVLDSGLTLAACVKYCEAEGAEKVYTATLVDKQRARDPGGIQTADFTGLCVVDKFIFGYGLDYKEFLRNEPGIFAVED